MDVTDETAFICNGSDIILEDWFILLGTYLLVKDN